MGNPIATQDSNFICFAFPDICLTPSGSVDIPIPYPNIGNLGNADKVSPDVYAGRKAVVHEDSEIESTQGAEAAKPKGGVLSQSTGGSVKFKTTSQSVFVNNKGVVRMFDATDQNIGETGQANAVGRVLGGLTTVFVGD